MKQILVISFLFAAHISFGQRYEADSVLLLMGSRFEITAIHEDKEIANDAVIAAIDEISSIESLISSWSATSQTSLINKNAGIHPVKVDEALSGLISRSKKISQLTDGAFDISFASISHLWNFNNASGKLPDSSEVESLLHLVNYKNIILNKEGSSVFLKNTGMKIGFGGIGKGFAANKAKEAMLERGIKSGLINAGGDLTAWGSPKDKTHWEIGIADPEKKKAYKAWLAINDLSVVTSGDYEHFLEIDGVKYSHIINPKTGFPAMGIKSVTIISPDAELSDALATSVFVMGVEHGLSLINSLKNVECLIIDSSNKFWQSKNLDLNFY